MTTLEIKNREKTEKLDILRKNGMIPAVFYGKNTPSTPISISYNDFLKVWKTVGESGVVTLNGTGKPVDALIHSVDIDPISNSPIHADFYVFEKGKKIEVSVPIDFIGISPAVKDLGGNLIKALHEIKISADPQNIPHSIQVDISSIKTFDDQIIASEVLLPKGVSLIENPEEVVASVTEPKDEPIESAPVDLSSIEVEKKGKKEEEGEIKE